MKNFKKYVTTERVVMVVIIIVGIVLFSYFWNEKKQDDLYMLGYRYQYGIDMPQDTIKAVECFKELAESGNVKAQFWLGKYYESLYDTIAGRPQAYAWYLKAANAGYPDAQNAVGECFYKGIGVEKDDKAAMAWSINSAAGQYNIGKCYHIGRGIEQDYKQAVAWYEKAVEQGYAKAQVNLGKCYIKGTGVEEDIEKGASLMVKAAIQGDPLGETLLGYMYYIGFPVDDKVEQDYDKAVLLWYKAAKEGNGLAQFYLGSCYYVGEGMYFEDYYTYVKGDGSKKYRDKKTARYWWDSSLKQGEMMAKMGMFVERYKNQIYRNIGMSVFLGLSDPFGEWRIERE